MDQIDLNLERLRLVVARTIGKATPKHSHSADVPVGKPSTSILFTVPSTTADSFETDFLIKSEPQIAAFDEAAPPLNPEPVSESSEPPLSRTYRSGLWATIWHRLGFRRGAG